MMGVQDVPEAVVDPYDTTRIRKLLDPVMRRNEKHTLLTRGPAEDAFLHALITEGIVPILDEISTFAGPYLAAMDERVREAAAGTTPDSAPREPAVASRHYPRANELAALEPDEFMREAHLLPVDELERLAVLPLDGDVDVFDGEQRKVIDEILSGRRASNVFEIQCTDPMPKTGDIVEYEGKMVVMLGLSETEDRMRVAYVDMELRRDDVSALDARTIEVPVEARLDKPFGDLGATTAAPAEFVSAGFQCVDCDHEPFKTAAALKGHRTKSHPEQPE